MMATTVQIVIDVPAEPAMPAEPAAPPHPARQLSDQSGTTTFPLSIVRPRTGSLPRDAPVDAQAVQAAEDADSVCYICLDDAPPLLVGSVCDCKHTGVHECCLENWINHSTNPRVREELAARMSCGICMQPYRMPYELTPAQLSTGTFSRRTLIRLFVVAIIWLGLGAGIATACYEVQIVEIRKGGKNSPRYSALMTCLCIYAMVSIGSYVYVLSKLENMRTERERAVRERIHFTHLDPAAAEEPKPAETEGALDGDSGSGAAPSTPAAEPVGSAAGARIEVEATSPPAESGDRTPA
jgi:hypothetical protein